MFQRLLFTIIACALMLSCRDSSHDPQISELRVYDGDIAPSQRELIKHWNAFLRSVLGRGFDVEITTNSGENQSFHSKYFTFRGTGFQSIREGYFRGKHELYVTNSDYRFQLTKASDEGAPWINEGVTLNDPNDSFPHDLYDSGFLNLIPAISDFSLVDLVDDHGDIEFSVKDVTNAWENGEPCFEAFFVIQRRHTEQSSRLLNTARMSYFVQGKLLLLKNHYLLPKRIEVSHFERSNSESDFPTANQRTEIHHFDYGVEPFFHPSRVTSRLLPVGNQTEFVTTMTFIPSRAPGQEEFRLPFYGLPEPIVPNWYDTAFWTVGISCFGIAMIGFGFWLNRRIGKQRIES